MATLAHMCAHARPPNLRTRTNVRAPARSCARSPCARPLARPTARRATTNAIGRYAAHPPQPDDPNGRPNDRDTTRMRCAQHGWARTAADRLLPRPRRRRSHPQGRRHPPAPLPAAAAPRRRRWPQRRLSPPRRCWRLRQAPRLRARRWKRGGPASRLRAVGRRSCVGTWFACPSLAPVGLRSCHSPHALPRPHELPSPRRTKSWGNPLCRCAGHSHYMLRYMLHVPCCMLNDTCYGTHGTCNM